MRPSSPILWNSMHLSHWASLILQLETSWLRKGFYTCLIASCGQLERAMQCRRSEWCWVEQFLRMTLNWPSHLAQPLTFRLASSKRRNRARRSSLKRKLLVRLPPLFPRTLRTRNLAINLDPKASQRRDGHTRSSRCAVSSLTRRSVRVRACPSASSSRAAGTSALSSSWPRWWLILRNSYGTTPLWPRR